jgi:hypothetical protein
MASLSCDAGLKSGNRAAFCNAARTGKAAGNARMPWIFRDD